MRLLKRQGSILVLVLGILAISTILLSALVQLVEVANKQTAISKDIVRYRTVLDSLLDYTIYGIKQRWCFDGLMLEDVCTWNHTASAERLIMSDNVSRSLGEILSNNPAFPATPPFRIPTIDITVPIASITTAHPLFRAILPAQSAIFSTMRFEMWRVTNTRWASHGEEAIVGIRVTLNSTTTLFRGLTALNATAYVMVYPRQLNQFSLIVPRDLRMDLGTSASADGDANIMRFAARSGAGVGLSFESPVFVNRNVHIPPFDPGADPPYAPVTFAQRVVIGDGRVYEDTALMSPATPGGELSRTYDQTSGIGGFLRGIEIDGAPDRGLEVFTGALPVVPPSPTAMNRCRDYLAARSDLSVTKGSPLYIQQGTTFTPGPTISYNLALGGNNGFNPQRVNSKIIGRSFALGAPNPPTSGGWAAAPTISNSDPSVGYLYASFGALSLNFFQARMAPNSTVTATFIATAGVNPQISISLVPVLRFGNPQPNEMELVVSVAPGGNYAMIPSPIRIYFKAYDYGHHNAADRRKTDVSVNTFDLNNLREANIELVSVPVVGLAPSNYIEPLGTNDSHQVLYASVCPGTLPMPMPPPAAVGFVRASACSGVGAVTVARGTTPFSDLPPSAAVDYSTVQTGCEVINSTRGTAMGMADWSTVTFLNNTRDSWNFRPLDPATTIAPGFPAPVAPELTFDATTNNSFVVNSIVGRCRITAGALTVQAMLGCDELIIDPRGNPLTINGTILAGKTNIAPGALSAGIRWRSLRHPQAVYDLRTNAALMTQSDFLTPCPNALPMPEFSPAASILEMATQQACSPMKFALAADPFTWATVDPDCGINSGDVAVTCKRRPLRYIVREISRTSD